MLPSITETMSQVGSSVAGLMVAYAMFQNYFPYELQQPIKHFFQKLISLFYPYLEIIIPEYQGGDSFERSVAYTQVEWYLNGTTTQQAKRLQANVFRDSAKVILTMDNQQVVTEEYQGIKVQWTSIVELPNRQTITMYRGDEEKKSFELKFHKKHRDVIIQSYLKHVLAEGKAIQARERRRLLYTNHKSEDDDNSPWTYVAFRHPATFDTLAMDPAKKKEIMDDLINFSKAKDFYASIGKAWKRGYLLYGPPGTGKSTMIAAMANLLKYDVYDLELTAVKDNTELRKLLINTSSKAIIVIEDIDCSLDLTAQREKKKEKNEDESENESENEDESESENEDEEKKDGDSTGREKERVENVIKACLDKKDKKKSKEVTLSGLLNFIDGLWSACGEERIIIFTTNYVEKLDPALIRRGRMDKHIEMSYCGFEAFKCLAKSYMRIESHELFPRVKELLEEIKMSPADIAEELMPKAGGEDTELCLMQLVKALEEAKDQKKKKIR